MAQVLAVREGTASWLIPQAFRQKYLAQGFRLLPSPHNAPTVSTPTQFNQVDAGVEPIAPAREAGGTAPASPQSRKRGRPKGSRSRRGRGR